MRRARERVTSSRRHTSHGCKTTWRATEITIRVRQTHLSFSGKSASSRPSSPREVELTTLSLRPLTPMMTVLWAINSAETRAMVRAEADEKKKMAGTAKRKGD